MQEHIKLPLHPDTCSTDGWSTDEQRVLREFAQAVARECVKVVDARCSSERIAQLDAEGWSVVETNALSAGLEGASEAIRARFGVE